MDTACVSDALFIGQQSAADFIHHLIYFSQNLTRLISAVKHTHINGLFIIPAVVQTLRKVYLDSGLSIHIYQTLTLTNESLWLRHLSCEISYSTESDRD